MKLKSDLSSFSRVQEAVDAIERLRDDVFAIADEIRTLPRGSERDSLTAQWHRVIDALADVVVAAETRLETPLQ